MSLGWFNSSEPAHAGTVLYYGSNRFGRVELPQPHVKLPCTPGSLSQTVVRAGSKGLNHPELMSNY